MKVTSVRTPSFWGTYPFLVLFPFFCLTRFAIQPSSPSQNTGLCKFYQAVFKFKQEGSSQPLTNQVTAHFIPSSWAALLSFFSFASCSLQKGKSICSSPVYSFKDTLLHAFLLAKPTPLHKNKYGQACFSKQDRKYKSCPWRPICTQKHMREGQLLIL